jgi:hypothetical protein
MEPISWGTPVRRPQRPLRFKNSQWLLSRWFDRVLKERFDIE